ncbi:MAG: ethanolamine utilization protein [Rhodopirellula sp.]|nr:ethanolamine utilization protein [Rhodopirellula sp.]
MDEMLRAEPDIGFGGDPFNPHKPRPIEVVGGCNAEELKKRVMESCPRVPGVYGMLDRRGCLIYVGKSKSLRSRLLSYFAASNAREKGGRIIENARAIQWETQPSEFAALVREQYLIRKLTPRWNVQGVPQRQRPVYLCLGRSPAYFFLAAVPPPACIGVEGPFFGAARMRRAVDCLNKVFRLRDCSEKQVFHFAEQLQLFDLEHRPGCLRLEVGTCAGPCAAACTRSEYDALVSAAESFLDGFNHEPLLAIQEQMKKAIANRQYELAGRAHETSKSLQYIDRKLVMLARARRRYTFIYAVPGYDGCGAWYLIHCGEIADVVAAPRNQQEYDALRERISHWTAVTSERLARGHGEHPHTLQLVASWFRKHRDELDATFPTSQKFCVPSNGSRLGQGLSHALQS